MTLRQDKTDHSKELNQSGSSDTSGRPIAGFLDFSPETERVLTPFRKGVLNDIYRTAFGISAGRLETATVLLSSTSDEEDSLHLDLTLTVNADWDAAQELAQEILCRVSEWSKEWPERDREDYGRWIYFGVIPTEL